uniref:Uncharacterized protein n=1 Tax=Panagrellus redivivus TaxID=6233 RepID=A0A7E4UUT5_PANRE
MKAEMVKRIRISSTANCADNGKGANELEKGAQFRNSRDHRPVAKQGKATDTQQRRWHDQRRDRSEALTQCCNAAGRHDMIFVH